MKKLVMFIMEIIEKYDDLEVLEDMMLQEYSITTSDINKKLKRYIQKMNGRFINANEDGSLIIKEDGKVVEYTELFTCYYGKTLKFYVDKETKTVRKYLLFHELVDEDYISINRGFLRWYKVNIEECQGKVCAYIEMDIEPQQYSFVNKIENLVDDIRIDNDYKNISFENEEKFNFSILAFNKFIKESSLSGVKIRVKTDVFLDWKLNEFDKVDKKIRISETVRKIHEQEAV
ncbi:MAG: hypothetical protein SPE00_05865 [Bacilli bacterium]|nr:hypothetical protein [Bacilli bacterium]